MTGMTPERLDAIRERADAATKGPWVHGDRWHIQGASHCHCAQYGPLIHEGHMDINGRMMQAHVHERERKWLHGIYALPSGGTGWHPLNVVNDTDEYGYMDDFDADFIAHARDDVPALLAEVERQREGIEALHSAVQEFESCPNLHGCDDDACTESVHNGERYHEDRPTGRVCLTCRDEDGAPLDWPCPTVALLNPTEGDNDE